jgi:hypothetical protein
MRKGRLGLPWFEVLVVFSSACLLLTVLADRVLYVLESAEKSYFELTLMNMRTGIKFEQAQRIVAGRGIADLSGSNPIRFLSDSPQAYLGERAKRLSANEIRVMPSSAWMFVREDGILYYKPEHNSYLVASEDAPLIGVRVRIARGGDVEVLAAYQWF